MYNLGVRVFCPICKNQQFQSKLEHHIKNKCKAYKESQHKFKQCRFNPSHWEPADKIGFHESMCGITNFEVSSSPSLPVGTSIHTPNHKETLSGNKEDQKPKKITVEKAKNELETRSSFVYSQSFSCPFDPSHVLQCNSNDDAEAVAKKVDYHIRNKCKVAQAAQKKVQQCPYNRLHWLKEEEMKKHIDECPDGEKMQKVYYPPNLTTFKLNLSRITFNISDDEEENNNGCNSPTLRKVIRKVCSKAFELSRQDENRGSLPQNISQVTQSSLNGINDSSSSFG